MSPWNRRMLGYVGRERRGIALLLGAAVLLAVCDWVAPWPVKLIIDYAVSGKPLPAGWAWLGSLVGSGTGGRLILALSCLVVTIFVVRRLTMMAMAYLKASIGAALQYKLAEDVYDHLLSRSSTFFGRQSVGDLTRRVGEDSGCVRDLFMNSAFPVVLSVMSLSGILVLMWRVDRWMSLAALVVIVPLALTIRLYMGPMTRRGYAQAEQEGVLATTAERTLSALPMVQAMGQEPREDRGYHQATLATMRAYLGTIRSQLGFQISVAGVNALGVAALFLLGGYRGSQGLVSVGDLYLFLAYLTALYAPIESMAQVSTTVALARARAQRLRELLDEDEPIRDPARPVPLRLSPAGGIDLRLRGVRAGYDPGRPVLCDVDLDIEAGRCVALVGASGVGKTTLACLLARFIDPWEGAVTANGIDLRQLSLKDLRGRLAWVPQDPMLLPMTLAQNIAFGRPDASREQIIAAAKAAQLHDFVSTLPEGYDTPIGERGARLSGGQAQRVSIARALLKDAPLIVMDEPTSALDTQTEAALMRAIDVLRQGRTLVMIAHRLSTIRRADQIVVLAEGRVAEQGTHEQLIALGGIYHRFASIQHDQPDAPRESNPS